MNTARGPGRARLPAARSQWHRVSSSTRGDPPPPRPHRTTTARHPPGPKGSEEQQRELEQLTPKVGVGVGVGDGGGGVNKRVLGIRGQKGDTQCA